MLKGFLGNNGTREHGPSVQILTDEREEFKNAMHVASENRGSSHPININGQKVKVVDDGSARLVKPA